jgi:hypothetical protein
MRLLGILILIVALIAGYSLLMQNRQERESRYHVSQFKPYVEKLTAGGRTGQRSLLPNEASLFELLFFLHKSESAGVNLDEMISGAFDELKLPDGFTGLAKESIRTNYDLAKKFQLFDDLENALKLERGEAATIKAQGWQDEKVVVGQIVSPLLAPEAAQSLPNLQLMPEPVRDAITEMPTAFTLERAGVFERNQIITRESLDRVKAMLPAAR